MPTSQPLAHKDASLFKQVLKAYETKQYKKGLKTCEQILKKNPNHGETMAMKGLIINALGRTEEAFAIAKDAVKQDMRSHVVWHVYGLLYRSEKMYDKAIGAYKMALRFEPESAQILRDLALLQIQMRDYHGYIETRKTIMQQRPQLRQNWTALAIGHHLVGDYANAEKVLSKFEDTIQGNVHKWDFEHWETCLYKNRIIGESGDTERALEHLNSIAKNTLDKTALYETRAEYLLKLGRMEEAQKAYQLLLDRNPERRAYYAGLEKAMGIDPSNRKAAKPIYDEYAEKYERCDAARRIPLDFLEGDDFKAAADSYLRAKLNKGVPSTFANIKALYADPAKREIIFSLVNSYNEEQEKEEPAETNGDGPKASQFRIWTLYFLAQHYDHYRTRDMTKALEYLEKAIKLAPKTLELYMTEARVYKHAGDLQTAMEKMDTARKLDKSDRYINTKTAKYQLRNDRNDDAIATMGLFTRNDVNPNPLTDLIEMQCIWYLTESAESHFRQKQLGLTLKRYATLLKIFDDWAEDQFDFHSFSLRKGQIRAYVDMLKWEDSLRSHPFYTRAALGAIEAYIYLFDHPTTSGEPELDKLSEADRKKYLKKQKRDETKAKEAAAAKAAKEKEERNKNASASDDTVKKEDTDPLGVELAKTKTPLEEAKKWLDPLVKMSGDTNARVQLIAIEVERRRQKWLLALKALKKAKEIDPQAEGIWEATVRLRKDVSALPTDAPSLSTDSRTLFEEELLPLLAPTADLAALTTDYENTHSGSPAHLREAARVRKVLGLEGFEDALMKSVKVEKAGWKDGVEAVRVAREVGVEERKVKEVAGGRWGRVAAFK
ncbi:N-terminal acetyltransferase A, auxiliary subunit [Ascodesmis nigricans]|uniref:N-terminal acetyltransferase A, auxiliary subunit n=1 Tax=Ascodesmis nigricans TaxID=341454 RepID=A0A4S2MZI8_9PEZI|nr:N-terminal acetyltransferase A, auxiliary subunit [Ascodesmis nigricans]